MERLLTIVTPLFYYCIIVCKKCIIEIFIFVRRSRVLKNFEAGKTNFIIRQTVAGPGRARAARDDKTFALNSSLLMRENYV